MTLSALSMQMKSLESSLGVALFDRSVRPPRLTPVGRAIVDEAIPLLQHEENLREICRPSDGLTGRIRLGFITTAAVRLLPPLVLAAQQQAPRAAFEFETGLSAVLQEKVVSGQLDAAVVTDTDGLPGILASHTLRREPLAFAAHEALLGDGLPGLLASHTFFHFMPDTGIGKLIARAMADHARPPEAATVHLDNLEAIMECVVARLGFTLLPVPDVDRYSTSQIIRLPAPGILERKLVLVTRRDSALTRRAPVLAALLGTPDQLD